MAQECPLTKSNMRACDVMPIPESQRHNRRVIAVSAEDDPERSRYVDRLLLQYQFKKKGVYSEGS